MSALVFLFYLAAFWLALYIVLKIIFKDKEKITVMPFLLIVKLGIGERFLKRAEGNTYIKILGVAFLLLAIFSAALFYYYVIPVSLLRLRGEAVEGGLVPIIPGITIRGETAIYLLLNIGLAATIHELAHAIIARNQGIKIKSAGFILAAFIPIAFVEPDSETFKSKPLRSKAYVYSAGPASNLSVAVLFLLFLTLMSSVGGGVSVVSVEEGSPAERAGLEKGFVIQKVNNTVVKNIQEFQAVLGDYREREAVFVIEGLKPDGSPFNVTLHKLQNETALGIGIANALPGGIEGKVIYLLAPLVVWGYVVNLSLAIINAAPLFITDGGRMLSDLIESKIKSIYGKVLNFFIQIVTLLVLLSSLSLSTIG